MKHSFKITFILLGMFLLAQIIGIAVSWSYAPQVQPIVLENGTLTNITTYNLPPGFEPPQDTTPKQNLTTIVMAIIIAIALLVLLMRVRAEVFLRVWFFAVVALALAITFNAALRYFEYSFLIAFVIAVPLSFLKIFHRNIYLHNITELAIYPGIAALFIPLLNITTVIILLIIISLYDMYAVWHSGFMQKMANYQMKTLRIFSGFFIPYRSAKELKLAKNTPESKLKKVKVHVAILGGGDVVFPIIVAGIVLHQFGLAAALIVSVCATLALAGLFYASEKGKFYPAMPFISLGCFVALGIIYLLF